MSYNPSQVFELTLKGRVDGKPTANVFHYAPLAGQPNYAGAGTVIGNNFEQIVVAALQGICNQAVFFDEVVVTELFPGALLTNWPLTTRQGAIGGENSPPFVAWAFKSARKSRAIRAGFKRIAGVSETWQANGVATSAITTPGGVVSVNMGLPLNTAGAGNTTGLYPIVYSDTLNNQPRTTKIAELADNWAFSKISSQVSRRF